MAEVLDQVEAENEQAQKEARAEARPKNAAEATGVEDVQPYIPEAGSKSAADSDETSRATRA
ncbi:MAG TPA: hypothetical protein VE821_07180, partial [Pyrinomonadaceae bacterium]|nr:hypothetical protein [Pyrinomonadaceae bacterium]